MLVDMGLSLVLVGHSERREHFGETDEVVRRKLEAALRAGIAPILCLGETLAEREAGRTEEVVDRQLTSAFGGLGAGDLANVTLAYEPVWAIGTGVTATPEQAQEVHAFLRSRLAAIVDDATAARMRFQYGGSVKPGNIVGLMDKPDIDGALVGGASLDAASFADIVRFGRSS
jgi:triosephosphate isomerase